MLELIKKVEEWAEGHGYTSEEFTDNQYLKVIEEFGELCRGILKKDEELIIDSIGDTLVTLIILNKQINYCASDFLFELLDINTDGTVSEIVSDFILCLSQPIEVSVCFDKVCSLSTKLGYEPSHCLEVAYNVIKDRKITLKNGTLVKE